MQRIFLFTIIGLLVSAHSIAQNSAPWNGKKCAVVLTYDDAINEQLDNAIPVLDSLGLKATFYITGFSSSMQTRLADWKKIAAKGYELGNHTLYHPCAGGKGREWVTSEHDLNKYTMQRIVEETKATNVLLQAMDGKTKRTFAFPCADTRIGDSSYAPLIKNNFVAMRNVRAAMHHIDEVKLDDVDCYMVNGESGDQLVNWVKKATETNALLVILFHGVGGGNSLNVSLDAHRQLLVYLKQQIKDIWIAPMIDVAEYIKKYQSK